MSTIFKFQWHMDKYIELPYFGKRFIVYLHLYKKVILEKMTRRNIERWCTVREKNIIWAILFCYSIMLCYNFINVKIIFKLKIDLALLKLKLTRSQNNKKSLKTIYKSQYIKSRKIIKFLNKTMLEKIIIVHGKKKFHLLKPKNSWKRQTDDKDERNK